MCSMAMSAKVAWSAMPAPYPGYPVFPHRFGPSGLEGVVLLQALDEAMELDVVAAELPLLAVLGDGDGVPLAACRHLHRRPPLLVDQLAHLFERRIIAPSSHPLTSLLALLATVRES